MNHRILYRSLFWLIPRALVLLVALYFVPWVEWSPLPDLSIPLSYLYHFVITLIFARIAFGKHWPTWKDAGVVSAVFVIGGTLIEILLTLWRSGASLRTIATSYNWHSLFIVLTYVAAVFLAALRARKRNYARNAAPVLERSSVAMPPSSVPRPPEQV